jgi:hypothetical protein
MQSAATLARGLACPLPNGAEPIAGEDNQFRMGGTKIWQEGWMCMFQRV